MSKVYQERRPLLCEEASGDELPHCEHSFPRKSAFSKGHAKNKIKGAANIIGRWPDNLLSIRHYWPLFVMLCLIVFIFYHVVTAFSMLSSNNLREYHTKKYEPISYQDYSTPHVYMHIIIDEGKKVNVEKYSPHIETVIHNFPALKYKFIVLLNDTDLTRIKHKPAEIYNENALTFEDDCNRQSNEKLHNVIIEHKSLSHYLDLSPIKMKWRHLPSQFIPFLVRAIAIWDNGGIAFDPKILLPSAHQLQYKNKLFDILDTYSNLNDVNRNVKPSKSNVTSSKPKKTLNNIREIIDALENGNDNETHIMQVNLTENENKITDTLSNEGKHFDEDLNFSSNAYEVSDISSNKLDLLKNKTLPNNKDIIDDDDIFKNRGVSNKLLNKKQLQELQEQQELSKKSDSMMPMIIAPNDENHHSVKYPLPIRDEQRNIKLIIDLKGKIIATQSHCHAFIGTLFTKCHHYYGEQNISDFINRELSLFCHGLLSSCKGIDVILI